MVAPVPVESLKRWTSEELSRLIDLGGFLDADRYELIQGQLVEKMGQNDAHATAVWRTQAALRTVFGNSAELSSGTPVRLSNHDEPEPDITVVRELPRAKPTAADVVMLVEISDSSLRLDQTVKATLYAQHRIPEYWIVDVLNRRLEVRRRPQPETGEWTETLTFEEGTSVSPLGAAGPPIKVSDLLIPLGE